MRSLVALRSLRISESDAGVTAGGRVHTDRGASHLVAKDIEDLLSLTALSWDGSGGGACGSSLCGSSALLLLLLFFFVVIGCPGSGRRLIIAVALSISGAVITTIAAKAD